MTQETPIPAVQCAKCSASAIPPQYVCRRCGHTEFNPAELKGKGTVYTHTTIRVAPEAYRDQAPYTIAIVELSPELRVTARISGETEAGIAIGQELWFDRVDEFGYWFSPAD